ncbi:thiol peroxidase [Enterovibrio calviensis]|uniref:thiol peroxidase n=1 Tax=Enterovibrio calviensis TaxID=91359 RepID=UPI000485CBEB|nr:thiol peroxidase [Enterovibrio calviensis]
MSIVTFQGNELNIMGNFPAEGDAAPSFVLCADDLSDITLADFSGKKLILNIFPSIDTPVCANSVRAFNEIAGSQENTTVLCVSADLPFAAGRFCGAEGIENVKMASLFRSECFATDYGVAISEGPLRGLATRAVIVINEKGTVVYSERVSEVIEEPSYGAALNAL